MASTVEILIRARDQYSAALKKADKNMRQLVATGATLAGAGLAVTGALVKMAQESADLGDQFQKASLKTGVATEELSALKFAAEQSGTSFEVVEKSLAKLAVNASKAAEGTKTQADAFDALGVSVTDANGNLRPMNDVLLESADRFATMKNDTEAAALAQDVFGKSGVDLIPLLKEGRDGIEALAAQASALGVVYSQDLANSSADLLDAQNELKTAMAGVSQEISETIIPVMTSVIGAITPVVVKFREFTDAHPELVRVIGVLGVSLTGAGGLLLGFAGLVKVLPIIKTGLTGLSGATVIIPLIALIAGLSANLFTMRTELASIALFIQSKFLGALSKLVGALNLLPKSINPFSDGLDALEEKLADMAAEADDTSNALLVGKDAMDENRAAAEELERQSADLVLGFEDVTVAAEEEGKAVETVTDFFKRYNQELDLSKDRMSDADIAARDLELATLGLGTAIDNIPPPPSIFTQEWAKPQIANADKMLDGFETHTKTTVDAIIAEAERQKTDTIQKAKDASAEYKETFTSIKTAFGDTFQSMVASGTLELGKIKDLFLNTFSAIFFEDILGSFVSSFIAPFVQKLKDGLLGIFANIGIGAVTKGAGSVVESVTGAASSAAGGAASTAANGNAASFATGGLSALATGIGSFAGTLIGSLFQANKQKAIEENTRFTHTILTDMMNDRLQPMKETLEWMREIQTGVLGKLGEDMDPKLATLVSELGAILSAVENLDTNRSQALVLDETAASTAASVAGNAASFATGGLSALATGAGAFLGTLGSGLFQANKQRAIEENTRRTYIILTDMMNDRLQPMKETLEWVREIQTGVLGQSAGREQCGISGETLGSGLFQANKQKAIEENTRFTHTILTDMMNDRLQPMKETLEWVREIQTGVLGKLGEDMDPKLATLVSEVSLQRTNQETIADKTHELLKAIVSVARENLEANRSQASIARENLEANRSQALVLDETIIGEVVAGALNDFVTQAGGELVASELL